MDYDQTIKTIYRAAAHSESWSNALCGILDHVGAVAGNIVYQAPDGKGSFLIAGRMREDLNALYLERYAANPYAYAFQAVKPGEIALGNRLIDAKSVRRSAYYADICAPQHIFNQLFLPHASMHERGGIGGIAVFLSRQQDEHAARAMTRLRRHAPHITNALDLWLGTMQLATGGQYTQRLLDAIPDAALLIDAQGVVISLNMAAQTLLGQNDGLFLSGTSKPVLAAQCPDARADLAKTLRKALMVLRRAGDAPDGAAAIRISRPSGKLPYLLTASPLVTEGSPVWQRFDVTAKALIRIVDPVADTQRKAHQLARIYGLTPTETKVAALIGDGLSLPAIAQALKLSPTTVKTHASRCFAKTGVNSQAALIKLITAIPVAG
jgi:DNA-binding CsgD family transcriptional regulator